MQSYVCIANFVYMQDKYGKPYGWGVAEYTTPEKLFGYDHVTSAYSRETGESRKRIIQHLTALLPTATEQQIIKIMRG